MLNHKPCISYYSSLCSEENLNTPIEREGETFKNFFNTQNTSKRVIITNTKVPEPNNLLEGDESLVNPNFSSSSLGVEDLIDEALNDTDDFNDNIDDLSSTVSKKLDHLAF